MKCFYFHKDLLIEFDHDMLQTSIVIVNMYVNFFFLNMKKT